VRDELLLLLFALSLRRTVRLESCSLTRLTAVGFRYVDYVTIILLLLFFFLFFFFFFKFYFGVYSYLVSTYRAKNKGRLGPHWKFKKLKKKGSESGREEEEGYVANQV
jgi:hypothetical protein